MEETECLLQLGSNSLINLGDYKNNWEGSQEELDEIINNCSGYQDSCE